MLVTQSLVASTNLHKSNAGWGGTPGGIWHTSAGTCEGTAGGSPAALQGKVKCVKELGVCHHTEHSADAPFKRQLRGVTLHLHVQAGHQL